MHIHVKVNDREHTVETRPDRRLLHLLREDLGLTGPKEGCGVGDCGACTVLLNGKAVNSCLTLVASVQDMEITTIEGLMTDGELSPLQRAFVEQDAVQCGFCIPGMITSAQALLNQHPSPTDDEVRHALAGNLCRCTGYQRIFAAVRAAVAANLKIEEGKQA